MPCSCLTVRYNSSQTVQQPCCKIETHNTYIIFLILYFHITYPTLMLSAPNNYTVTVQKHYNATFGNVNSDTFGVTTFSNKKWKNVYPLLKLAFISG